MLAFVGGFWLTQYVMKKLGAKDEEKQAEVWENRVEEYSSENNNPHMGDIIFQTSMGSQSQAIQLATHSKYSHVGIVFIVDGKPVVYEAVQPVRITPLQQWIENGKGKHYVVKRLVNRGEVLTPTVVQKMKSLANSFLGKNYDIYFGWSDNRFYCSELVWKVYKRVANIEIGSLDKLGNFDLEHDIVQKIMKERYGNKVPLEEKVISPEAMFISSKLITVVEQ